MKKIIIWLIKAFKVDITTEKIVIKEVVKQVALEGVINGDVTIKGNLVVEGSLKVTGEVVIFK